MYLYCCQTQPTFSYCCPITRQNRPFLRLPKFLNQNYYVPTRHHRNGSRLLEFLVLKSPVQRVIVSARFHIYNMIGECELHSSV